MGGGIGGEAVNRGTVLGDDCNSKSMQYQNITEGTWSFEGGVGVVDICGSANYTILYIEGRSEVII